MNKITKLISAISMLVLLLPISFSQASSHDDNNPNTFVYDRCMYNTASEIVATPIPNEIPIPRLPFENSMPISLLITG